MSRFILLILIGVVANWWWRNLQRQRSADPRERRTHTAQGDAPGAGTRAGPDSPRGRAPFARRSASQAALPEPMVSCALCDTHLPISEATVSGERHFCHPRHAHEYAVRVAESGDGR